MSSNDTSFHVRIGHFVPDLPAVDFLVEGYPVLTDRTFGQIPEYTEHEAAEYEVSVNLADSGASILAESVAFDPGDHYTLLLVGTSDDPFFELLADGPGTP